MGKETLAYLQKQIDLLQGFKENRFINPVINLGPVNHAFPQSQFPLNALHEFICNQPQQYAATTGFLAALAGKLIKANGMGVWIGNNHSIYPPALKKFGLKPEQVLFIHHNRPKEIQWAMEECLKCKGLAMVIAELKELDFTASRRLQLAMEKNRVTGFVLLNQPRKILPNISAARWEITSIPGLLVANEPGLGNPGWNLQLLKVKNGKTGQWNIYWMNNSFNHFEEHDLLIPEQKLKTG